MKLGFNENQLINLLPEIQMGKVPGASIHTISGINPVVGTSTVDIWETGTVYNYLSTAQNLFIHSSSASDTQEIKIIGLDSLYNIKEEIISLNGTSPKPTINQFLRIHSIENNNGTLLVGTIYLSRVSGSTSASNLLATINPLYQISQGASYTIPAGFTAFLMYGEATVGKNKDASVIFSTRSLGKVFVVRDIIRIFQNTISVQRPYSPIPEKTDLGVTAISENINTPVNVQYSLLLLDNSIFGL